MKKPEFFDYDEYVNGKKSDNLPTDSDPNLAVESVENTNNTAVLQNKKKKKRESPNAGESIRNAFDNALDEDVDEIAELASPANEILSGRRAAGFKRRLYFVIGIVVSIMSLIGFIFTIIWFSGMVKNVADNTKQKEEFARFIYPVVIIDPAEFDSTASLNSDAIISAAIWDIILYGDTSKYPTTFGNMTVPELDVELHATNIFGNGLQFDHKTLGDAMLSFYYDAGTKSYTIPVSPKFFSYSPLVEEIEKNGNKYTLRVGYVSPSPAWMITDKNSTPLPEKYMNYVVEINNSKDFTLISITENDEYLGSDDGL